jgi:uncharacterized alkaline shock family protein YloU
MMALHRLVVLLVFLLLLAVGVFGLLAIVLPGWWDLAVAVVGPDARLYGASAAGACICLAALLALTGRTRREKARILTFRNEDGAVSISSDAISEYLTRLMAEFPSIVKMRPRVVPRRNEVDIVADVRVKAGPQIHEICEMLQRRIRETMVSGLGISEVRRVEVSVKQISPEHKPD